MTDETKARDVLEADMLKLRTSLNTGHGLNDPATVYSFQVTLDRLEALAFAAPPAVLPRLTNAMIQAACDAHYGKGHNINGLDLTAYGVNWCFRDGFRRMWTGIRQHLKETKA